MDLITCLNTSFSYEGRKVLEGLNFSIKQGDYLCIIGENGSGKSTLMKGLIKLKNQSSGKIIYSDLLKKNNIGYLPQQTQTQRDFPASVFEVVLSGCMNSLNKGFFFGKKEKLRALSNMEKLNILDLKEACYRELSGGQQQRVLLARALCATDQIIFLDEPSAGLDPLITKELYNVIDDINRDLNITIVMVSHDIKSALEYGKSILHLNNQQLFFGSTQDYLKSDIGAHFLGGDFNDR